MTLWNLDYDEALNSWQDREHPDIDRVVAVLAWVLKFIDFGPPDERLEVPGEEDPYVSRIPEAQVLATYLALAYERRAIGKRFAR